MKKKTNFVILILAVMSLISCHKAKRDEISYPVKNVYGINILSDSLTEMVLYNPKFPGNSFPRYSLSASLEEYSALKVVITPDGDCNVYSGWGCLFWGIWDSFPVNPQNWTATEYNSFGSIHCEVPSGQIQTFTGKANSECNLRIQFNPVTNLACRMKIEIFENNSVSPTKIKYINLKM